jgi:PAS domain S-box-containing protein
MPALVAAPTDPAVRPGRRVWVLALVGVTAFVADLLTPLGMFDGFFYLAVVLYCLSIPAPRLPFYVAAALTPFMVLGFFLSPPTPTPFAIAVSNRVLSTIAVWIAAFLVARRLRDERTRRETLEALQRSEAALRETEGRYRALAANLPGGAAFIVDRDLRFLLAAGEALGPANVAPSMLEGKTIFEALPADLARYYEPYYRQGLAGQEFAHEHFAHGRYYVSRGAPLRDASGAVQAVLAVSYDITARRDAEAALRASEERFQTLADGSPVLLWVNGTEGCEFVNRAYREYLGVASDAAVRGNDWTCFVHPDDRDGYLSTYRRAFAARAPFDTEFRFRHHDGRWRWMRSQATPRLGPDGAMLGYVGASVDIEERKRVEEALRDSEQRMQLAVLAGGAGTWDLDLRTGRSVWSESHFTLLGYEPTPDCVASEPMWRNAVVPEDLPAVLAAWERAEREHEVFRAEHRMRRIDNGAIVWTRAVGRFLYDDTGRAIRFVGVFHDITAAKQAEMRLAELAAERESLLEAERAARREAEMASRLKDDFLANLSHELRSPLANIVGWARVLERKYGHGDAQLKNGLTIIVKNAMAQSALIGDLLDMSRFVQGKVTIDARQFALNGLVESCVASQLPHAEGKDLRIIVESTLDPGAHAIGDVSRLRQALANLLSNAIKFTPAGGYVTVRAGAAPGGFELSVADTGGGIAPEALPHIFDRFRQADGSTSRRHGGLGLGLAIVKQVVELHGGKVRAESAGVGQGAVFTLWLPAVTTAPAEAGSSGEEMAARAQLEALGPESLQGLEVVAVEDDPAMLQLVTRTLEERGARVLACASGADALTLLRAPRESGGTTQRVLVSDLGMPELDGFALIRAARGSLGLDAVALPALALTAYSRPEDDARARAEGFQVVLHKPYEGAQLVAAVYMVAQQARGNGAVEHGALSTS